MELNLPLDFYLLLHNCLTRHGNAYLKNLPQPTTGVFHLSQLGEAQYETDHWVEEKDLVNIILHFHQIGYFNFGGGNYLWEFVFEEIRRKKYPHLPARSDCFFLFGLAEDCRYYQEQHKIEGTTRKVNLIETRTIVAADMRILDDIPTYATAEYAAAQADRYWSGEKSNHPVIEYLFQGVCTVE